jgi:hypothetical protein
MKKIGGYIRKLKHKRYVEKIVTEMRGKVCSQAIMYGSSDVVTRNLYLKYNAYLKKLNEELD